MRALHVWLQFSLYPPQVPCWFDQIPVITVVPRLRRFDLLWINLKLVWSANPCILYTAVLWRNSSGDHFRPGLVLSCSRLISNGKVSV
jgi:hypothetical protein